jgi:4-amino-4-deoxy-L-arabinose transferase-like glycosyltransferase
LAFGPRAGLLAVVFALGSPLIISQFHVFMTDAPETAMVAVSVWLIIATERFSRTWVCFAAGVAVGLGELTKEPLGFFVAGVVLVTAIRGGWRAWRGFAVFAIVAFAIAMPWYIHNFSLVHGLAQVSLESRGVTQGIAPPQLSTANLLWYFWNIANFQIYVPLFAFSIIGGIWTIVGFARRRPVSPLAWELTIGAFVAWLAITETYVHDTRYGMPLLLYLAVFGSCWIGSLRGRIGRTVATSALVLFAIANTLGLSFGVGQNVRITLPGAEPHLLDTPGLLTFYTHEGFLVAGPHRDGDVFALMQALRRKGVREVLWINLASKEASTGDTPDFSEAGRSRYSHGSRPRLKPLR